MEVSLRSLELSLELSFFVDTVPRLKDGIPPSLHLRLRWRRDRPEQSTQEAPPAWYGNGLACLLACCQGSWTGTGTSGPQPSYEGGLRGGRVLTRRARSRLAF